LMETGLASIVLLLPMYCAIAAVHIKGLLFTLR
jgi:hypothetical protein